MENMELLKTTIWDITRPEKTQYATIMTDEVQGTKGVKGAKIQKQEWVVTDCAKESELKHYYNNGLRLKLSEKVLFQKQGDALYGVIHGQLGSNIIAAAHNSTTPSYVDTHKDCCVTSLLNILLLVCVKNISRTKVNHLYDGLQIISSTLTYTQKPGVSNSNFGDAVNDQVLATISQHGIFVFQVNYHKKVLVDRTPPLLVMTQYQILTKLNLIV